MRNFLRQKFTVSDSVKIGIDTAFAVAMFAYSIVILQKIAEAKMNELEDLDARLETARAALGEIELSGLVDEAADLVKADPAYVAEKTRELDELDKRDGTYVAGPMIGGTS